MDASPPLPSPSAATAAPPDAQQAALLAELTALGSCAVAFSGGVDSAVVAQAAFLALGAKAVAVTAVSPSLASGELERASDLARRIGIRHHVIETNELARPGYGRNGTDRCYHCKSELYDRIAPLLAEWNVDHIVNGANRDDLADYRPGMKAASERRVFSPLIAAGLTKGDVRRLARMWDLPVWDKPASPCLSSRIAYGTEVTPARLRRIDEAEAYLRSLGLVEVRVRCHDQELARLEVPPADLPRLASEPIRTELVARLKALGFRWVVLDLEGFRSGSLNAVLAGGGLPILGNS